MKAEHPRAVKHSDMSADPQRLFIVSRMSFAVATYINGDISCPGVSRLQQLRCAAPERPKQERHNEHMNAMPDPTSGWIRLDALFFLPCMSLILILAPGYRTGTVTGTPTITITRTVCRTADVCWESPSP